jgi:fermentation-respiration switch protein FrsA (DUF1100 family)
MVVADHDHTAATDVALKAYERALEPKRLVMIKGGHFDPTSVDSRPPRARPSTGSTLTSETSRRPLTVSTEHPAGYALLRTAPPARDSPPVRDS